MTVHIVVLILISLFGLIIYQKGANKRKNIQFTVLSMFVIFLAQALRGATIGYDTAAYIRNFRVIRENIYHTSSSASWEPFFILLNRFVGMFTKNPQWLLAACSLIIVVGVGYFIVENTQETDSAFWAVFFFICLDQYFSTMNLLRQSIAMAIAINVYTVLTKDFSKKGMIKSGILIVIAFLFHTSAFVSIVFFLPFIMKQVDRKQIVSVGIASIVVMSLYSKLLQLFMVIFPQYSKYLNSNHTEGKELGNYFLLLLIIKLVMIAMVFTLDCKSEKNKQIYQVALIIAVSVGMTILQTKIELAMRMGYYYEIFLIIFIPQFVNKLKNMRVQTYTLLYIAGWLYFIHLQGGGRARGCVPYYFFWQ